MTAKKRKRRMRRRSLTLVSGVIPLVSRIPSITLPRHWKLWPRWERIEEVARRREAPVGKMGLLGLLAAPVTVPLRMVSMIAGEMREQAEAEREPEAGVREELLELSMRHEAGEIGEEEYREREAELRRRLEEIGER